MGCVESNLQKNQSIVNLSQPKLDYYHLKDLKEIQKNLFESNTYLWIDNKPQNQSSQNALISLKSKKIIPIICRSLEDALEIINNKQQLKRRFRVISSDQLGQKVCSAFQYKSRIIHIYIFCSTLEIGKVLKQKWNKIKFFSNNIQDLISNIENLSRYDNNYQILPNFMEITNTQQSQDNTTINKSRYNLHGLMKFKNRVQAKNDFVLLAKYLFPGEESKSDIEEFQKQYPCEYNHIAALKWYSKQSFFYGLLNNFLRSSNDPLESAYLRLPFDATFHAIKYLYDQNHKQGKSFKAYRKGTINSQQLNYLQQNVGQFIEMYGFMSTSLDLEVTKNFLGNSLMIINIQNQQRSSNIDYGYVQISNYSQFKDEKQVLFNALNVYKIQSFQRQEGMNKITLKYGELAKIVTLKEDKLSKKENKLVWNYNHQQEIIKEFILDQGDVLKYCQMYQEEIKYRSSLYQLKYKGKQTVEAADQAFKLAAALWNYAQYNKSLQYYQSALAIYKFMFGLNHKNTVATIHNIGLVYLSKAEYDNALQTFEKAIAIKMKVFGEDHASTSQTIQSIANIYLHDKQYDKALQYFEKALKINKKVVGQNHSQTAKTLHNIGVLYQYKAQYQKSLSYYEQALKIKLAIFGENHSSTANTLECIAGVYQIQRQQIKSLEYFERALKINLMTLGQFNSNTAKTLQNIGILYKNKGQKKQAMEYFKRCYRIANLIFGMDHQFTKKILEQLFEDGNSYLEQDREMVYSIQDRNEERPKWNEIQNQQFD